VAISLRVKRKCAEQKIKHLLKKKKRYKQQERFLLCITTIRDCGRQYIIIELAFSVQGLSDYSTTADDNDQNVIEKYVRADNNNILFP